MRVRVRARARVRVSAAQPLTELPDEASAARLVGARVRGRGS